MSKSLPDLCIGSDGPNVRPIGIGTNAWGGVQAANSIPTNSIAVVKSALESGVRFFDTAEIYNRGRSERLLGEAIRFVADDFQGELDVVVATKFAPLPYRMTKGSIVRALNGSRDRIGFNRPIGLYQIHWPYTVLSTKALMSTLASAKRDGSILQIGVSNYNAKQLRYAHKILQDEGIKLASNQVNYSLINRAPEENGVLETCQELGLTLIAYFPLASGALSGKYRSGKKASGLRRFMAQFRNASQLDPLLSMLDELGKIHERTPAQVALNWLARQENVLPIPGARYEEQARENCESVSFYLADDEVDSLSHLSRSIGSMGGII